MHCKYCKIEGSEAYITTPGPHHDVTCPRWMRSRSFEEFERWRREEDFWWRQQQAGELMRRRGGRI